MDAYFTHQKFLKHYVSKSNADILEFGCGYGSTPLLREAIKGTNRKLYTYESDIVWLKTMEQEMPETENHKYIFAADWDNTLRGLSGKYKKCVIFIDQNNWNARYKTILAFKDNFEYIIIHDVDYFPENGIFGQKKGVCDYTFDDIAESWKMYYPEKPWPAPTGPPTLVIGEDLADL